MQSAEILGLDAAVGFVAYGMPAVETGAFAVAGVAGLAVAGKSAVVFVAVAQFHPSMGLSSGHYFAQPLVASLVAEYRLAGTNLLLASLEWVNFAGDPIYADYIAVELAEIQYSMQIELAIHP